MKDLKYLVKVKKDFTLVIHRRNVYKFHFRYGKSYECTEHFTPYKAFSILHDGGKLLNVNIKDFSEHFISLQESRNQILNSIYE